MNLNCSVIRCTSLTGMWPSFGYCPCALWGSLAWFLSLDDSDWFISSSSRLLGGRARASFFRETSLFATASSVRGALRFFGRRPQIGQQYQQHPFFSFATWRLV